VAARYLIKVWQDNNLLDSGNTNAGVFLTYLNDGTKYRIRAEDPNNPNKWVEIPDYLANSANSDRINLYLHS